MNRISFDDIDTRMEEAEKLIPTAPSEAIRKANAVAQECLDLLEKPFHEPQLHVYEHLSEKLLHIAAQVEKVSGVSPEATQEMLQKVSQAAKEIDSLGKYKLHQHFFILMPQLARNLEKKWDLSGSSGAVAAAYFRSLIDNFIDTYGTELSVEDRQILAHEVDLLGQAGEWDKQLTPAADGKEKTSLLLPIIQKKIGDLKDGESFFLYGGTALHAVIYKIKREDDTYSFEIYNTGEGAVCSHEGHPVRSTSGEDIIRSYKIKQCSLKNISSKAFLSHLLENYNRRVSMQSVMDKFAQLPIGQQSYITVGAKYPRQLRGSCTSDSYLAYMKGTLPRPLFRALQRYSVQFSASFISDIAASALRRSVLAALAVETLKMREAKFAKKVEKWNQDSRYTALFARMLSDTSVTFIEKYRKFSIAAIQEDPSVLLLLSRSSKSLTNDPKFIADALQMEVPLNLWEDRHFVEEAAKKYKFLILLASPQLVQDDAEFAEVYKKTALEALRRDKELANSIFPGLWKEESFVQEAIKIDRGFLRFVSIDLVRNPTSVIGGVYRVYREEILNRLSKEPISFRAVPETLPDYRDLALEALRKNKEVVFYIPEKLWKEKSFVQEARKIDRSFLRFVFSIDLVRDPTSAIGEAYRKEIFNRLSKEPISFRDVPETLPDYRDLALEALRRNKEVVFHIPEKLWKEKSFVQEARKIDRSFLRFVSSIDLIRDPTSAIGEAYRKEIFNRLSKESISFRSVPETLPDYRDLALEALRRNKEAAFYIPQKLWKEESFVQKAIEIDRSFLHFIRK